MKIYVASSWRNNLQPVVVDTLREHGHEVYDFQHPAIGENGFHWSEISPDWKRWSTGQFKRALGHRVAVKGFESDMAALNWCDACLLLLPSGRSAHLEAGYAIGAGKPTAIYLPPNYPYEPELMYKMATICIDWADVILWLRRIT